MARSLLRLCRLAPLAPLLALAACSGDDVSANRFATVSEPHRTDLQRERPSLPSAASRPFVAEHTDVTFDDVVGASHAKKTLAALMALWGRAPAASGLAAHPPKGALLTGPEGVGKGMLARAAARSAGLPLLQMSGAELLADGALSAGERIHALFVQARRQAPVVVLLTEVDALGSPGPLAGGALAAGRPEVLAQLLAELDLLSARDRVFAIATATSTDVLPPAFVSPGHFEHVIGVAAPSAAERHDLLVRLTRDIPQAPDVNLAAISEQLAYQTPATMVHLVQSAAAAALLEGSSTVRMADWEQAIDAFWLGPVDHSRPTSDVSRWRTAVHEAGHAVMATVQRLGRPVRKVSILPRAYARGVTTFLAKEPDEESLTEEHVKALLATAVGGIEAEYALTEHGVSEGSSSDLMLAQMVARRAVTAWGFSDELSRQMLGEFSLQTGDLDVGNATRDRVDAAIENMTKEAIDTARATFGMNWSKLATYEVAEALYARGELTGEEVRAIVAKHVPDAVSMKKDEQTADEMREWAKYWSDPVYRKQQQDEWAAERDREYRQDLQQRTASEALTSPASPSSTPPAPDQ